MNAPRIDESNFAMVGGVMVPQDKPRHVCKFCGAVFEDRGGHDGTVGVKNHERQCRAVTRSKWIAAALQGPIALKGPEAVADAVEQQIAILDGMTRDSWTENRGQ